MRMRMKRRMLRSRRRRKATKTFTEFIFGIVAYQFIHLISAHWLIWSLTFTRFCYAPNLSGMVTGGENDRRRRTEQQPLVRSVINLTRFDIESTPNRHRNNISPRTLTLFSIQTWCANYSSTRNFVRGVIHLFICVHPLILSDSYMHSDLHSYMIHIIIFTRILTRILACIHGLFACM